MKMIRLIPSNRAIGLFPKNPVTQELALDMDPAEIKMPLDSGVTFTFRGRSLKITQSRTETSPNGDEVIYVWVDLA